MRHVAKHPRLTTSLWLAVIAFLAAACGAAPETTESSVDASVSSNANGAVAPDTENGAAEELDKVVVGFIPAGIYSYLWHAEDAGYFAEGNLSVELTPMAGGGEVIPALESGTIQFGVSDALGVLNARNGGIQASYVSLNFAQASDDPVHAVLTNDPDVETPMDLVGKTVATNLSFNTDWTMMRHWLRQHEVDPDSVDFVEVPFPDMIGALRDGTLAAAGVVEPFYQIGLSEGYRELGHYFTEVRSPNLFTGLVAVEEFIDSEPGIVARFVGAVEKAIADFNADEQLPRDVIAANTTIDPELVDQINLGIWTTEANVQDLEFWIDAARSEGVDVSEEIEVESLLWTANE